MRKIKITFYLGENTTNINNTPNYNEIYDEFPNTIPDYPYTLNITEEDLINIFHNIFEEYSTNQT